MLRTMLLMADRAAGIEHLTGVIAGRCLLLVPSG